MKFMRAKECTVVWNYKQKTLLALALNEQTLETFNTIHDTICCLLICYHRLHSTIKKFFSVLRKANNAIGPKLQMK